LICCRLASHFQKAAEADKIKTLASIIWKVKMDRFEAMRTLVAAVDSGSLSAASRKLNVPLPTVSRRVSDLEAQLGSQLVVRTSRKLLLTETGAAYVASARSVLEELAEAERAASGEYRAPRGELLVTAPIAFGAMIVAPIVHEFLAAYPDVTVRLVLSDGVIDLVESHIDIAVRIGRLPDSNLIARRVGEIQWVVCACPNYLRRRGEPRIPSDLSDHDCLAFEGLQRYREWPFASTDGVQQITISPRFSVNTADGVIGGAVAGLGIARLMSYQAAASVREGKLVPILSDWTPPRMPVQLVHAAHRQQPIKLRAFLDYVAPRLQERLRKIAEQFETNKPSAITQRRRQHTSDAS
jgi:DNA-binding transcriptional LysR family regulator